MFIFKEFPKVNMALFSIAGLTGPQHVVLCLKNNIKDWTFCQGNSFIKGQIKENRRCHYLFSPSHGTHIAKQD